MSDTDPKHPPFLRRVSFIDHEADDPDRQVPVTVPSRLLLDGVDHSQVLARHGQELQILGQPEVLVSFVVYADYVTMQTPEGEPVSGSHIAGIPVLTPTDHEWELLPSDPSGRGRVRVWIFARQVEILAINDLPPAVEKHAADSVS
jgi:hypothetical protein